MKIKKIMHQSPQELYQARKDEAIVTGRPLIERPFWYENTETGQTYYDLYGCIGWPTEITNDKDELPGYVAILGILKSKKEENPGNALFQLLAEAESKDVPTLLNKMLELRAEYGFGLRPNLLETWVGDPDRFITTTALLNEKLREKNNSDRLAILISPPFGFYDVKVFDDYVRSMRSCLMPGNRRFYFDHNKILKNRIRRFMRDDPAVLAVGGVVHTLLHSTPWMDSQSDNCFVVQEGV